MHRSLLAPAAAIAMLALTGCATNAPDAVDAPPTPQPGSSTASPDAAPSTSAPEPSGASTEGWEVVEVADGAVTLLIPPAWTYEAEGPNERVSIFDEAGNRQISALVDREGYGAGDMGCSPDLRPEFTVLEQTEVDAPPSQPGGQSVMVAATVAAGSNADGPFWRFQAGLTNPYTLSDETCEVYYEVAMNDPINYAAIELAPEPLDALDFPSMEEASAYAQTDEFSLLQQILLTVQFGA